MGITHPHTLWGWAGTTHPPTPWGWVGTTHPHTLLLSWINEEMWEQTWHTPFYVLTFDAHACDFVSGSVLMSIRNYFRPSNGLSELMGSISVLKRREQGTWCPPCARSAEYFLHPVTVHSIVDTSPSQEQRTHPRYLSRQMFYDSSFITATAYWLEAFSGSLSHTTDSPTTTSHTSLYTW